MVIVGFGLRIQWRHLVMWHGNVFQHLAHEGEGFAHVHAVVGARKLNAGSGWQGLAAPVQSEMTIATNSLYAALSPLRLLSHASVHVHAPKWRPCYK